MRDKSLPPPYGPTSGTVQALQLLRKITPSKIDGDFLRANKIAPGNEYKVVGALRYLGLIDEAGRPTEKSRLLKTMGSTFTSALQEIIRNAYQGLFHFLNVEKATQTDIYNYFVTEAGLGAEMATKASRFFISLCRMAEIKLNLDEGKTSQPMAKKGRNNSLPPIKVVSRAHEGANSEFPLVLALTPEIANMDVDQLTELLCKLRTALARSHE
jgi:hypothetical protein